MTAKTICVYRVGEAPPNVEAGHGNYERWFRRLLAELAVTVQMHDGTTGTLPEQFHDYDGIVITGSPASLTEPENWMEAGIELIRAAYARRIPLLGVCFGHQMIGAAFGGSVIVNPAGWELSTYPVQVNAAGQRDPLFADLPASFPVNLSHRDIIDAATLSPMNGVAVLASSARCEVQAVAAGPHIRGVQFHPEFSGAITRAFIENRREILADEASAQGSAAHHPDQLLSQTTDCPLSETLFRNWVRTFVSGS